MVTADQIVASARKLEGTFYRTWYEGAPLPMWLYDGNGDPPDASVLYDYGCMCADLCDFALGDNGLPYGYGTSGYADFIINQEPFDPTTPGIPGAVALRPYEGPEFHRQGHIGLYTSAHGFIQSTLSAGVTEKFTDAETYAWGGSALFTIYGLLPGVDYSKYLGGESGEQEQAWQTNGWYQVEDNWNLTWVPPVRDS